MYEQNTCKNTSKKAGKGKQNLQKFCQIIRESLHGLILPSSMEILWVSVGLVGFDHFVHTVEH